MSDGSSLIDGAKAGEEAHLLSLLIAAAALEPTTGTLLNDAQRALQLGDRVGGQRILAEAKESQEKDDQAIRQRLTAHIKWDDCIKSESARVKNLQDPLDALAEVVLGMCLDQETETRVLASEVARRLEGLESAELRDDVEATVTRWRRIQKQTALAILARARIAK